MVGDFVFVCMRLVLLVLSCTYLCTYLGPIISKKSQKANNLKIIYDKFKIRKSQLSRPNKNGKSFPIPFILSGEHRMYCSRALNHNALLHTKHHYLHSITQHTLHTESSGDIDSGGVAIMAAAQQMMQQKHST